MENLQPPFGEHSNIHQESQDTHPMEQRHTATEDTEAVLSLLQYEQEHMHPEESNASLAHSEMRYEEFTDDQTQPVRMDHSLRLDAENMETSAASQMKLAETSQTSVSSSQLLHSLPKLHEELEDTLHRPSSSAHFNNVCHPLNLQATLRFPTSVHQEKQNPQPPSPPLNIKPVTLFTNINPSFVNPHFNPSWTVLVPHLNPNINASVPHHNPFCPIYKPKLNFNLAFKPNFTAPVACEDHSYSSLVLRPHLNVYPVCPTPNIYQPNVQMFRTNRDCSGRFPRDLQDSFRLWRRLCETARLFCSSSPDAEALACFFMRKIPSLSVQCSDLPFSAAVNVAVQEWRNTSNFEREPYYNTARMFIEMEEQDKSANRDPTIPQTDKSKGRRLLHSSGKVKKTGKRSKKVSVKDLAENALSEYSQVMESKVTDGSEVTVSNEEDVCALFLTQLLNDSESTTEAGFDIDYISSLLSTDVLKDNSQDVFSSINQEPVAGCSDWTHTMAQILHPSAVQHESSPIEGTNLLLSENNILEPFRDNVKGQNVFQTLTEPLLANPTNPNTLIQETIRPELQDFGLEGDGNQKDETLFVAELHSAVQSNGFNLQNYNSHQATFPHIIKHEPETPIDGGMEHDGEENMVVRQKTEKYMHVESPEDNAKMDSDIPNDSQRTINVCNKQKTIDQIEENNVNKNKKRKRRHRRQKHQKITLPVARTSPKSDDKDARRLKTAEYQPGKTQQKSTNAMKHEAKAQATDFKIIQKVQLQQHMNITETTSSATEGRRGNLRQHDKQIGKIREHLDDGFERRQRQLTTKAERESGKTYRKQENVLVKSIKEDRGDFHRRTEACQRLRRKMRTKPEKRWMK